MYLCSVDKGYQRCGRHIPLGLILGVMKASSVLVSRVKEIVSINGEVKLNNPVTISYQRYIGYNYTTKQHEYVPATVAIREVYRHGKKGEVRLSEGFNYWRPSELTSQECEAILAQLPN